MKLTEVEDIIETRLVPKLSQLPGVGLVSISGGQRPAVRIHVNPLALSSFGVNLDDLRTTIANLNVNTPKGNFDGPANPRRSTPMIRSATRTITRSRSLPTATAPRSGCPLSPMLNLARRTAA